jgi:hypothetical protein
VLNVRFEKFKGSEYMVLWMEAIHKGYGMDFFQSTLGGPRREVYTRKQGLPFRAPLRIY